MKHEKQNKKHSQPSPTNPLYNYNNNSRKKNLSSKKSATTYKKKNSMK